MMQNLPQQQADDVRLDLVIFESRIEITRLDILCIGTIRNDLAYRLLALVAGRNILYLEILVEWRMS
jgi:hypothetical protein